MADGMRISARLKGDIAEVRVLIPHPMDNGQRKDAKTGHSVAPHHITRIQVSLNGELALTVQTGTSVSKNPVFGFKLRGARVGDMVRIAWEDNKGEKQSAEMAVVSP